jgi:protein-tyrosine-phosphatase
MSIAKVLFVCVENSARSQMAEALARSLGAGVIEPYSAGSRPSGQVRAEAVKVMAELGIDISASKSKGFNQLPTKDFDYVITLGCRDKCPFYPAHKHIEWDIPDPEQPEDFIRVRDKIKTKLLQFIFRLKLDKEE